jgi:uncharacterized lipoprotein
VLGVEVHDKECRNFLPHIYQETLRKGKQMKLLKIILSALAISYLAGCAIPVTKVDVQSFEIKKKGIDLEKATSKLTGVLVDNGFDVKMVNKDAGIVTTEYKKFASVGGNPPFDIYMQVKARIKDVKGETVVQLIPIVKEQNRTNMAAFSEHELSYYTGEPNNIRVISSMHPGGWRTLAQTTFMNLVGGVAEAFGVKQEDVVQNVTSSQADALGAN